MKVDAEELQSLVDALPSEQPSPFGMRWVCALFLTIFVWFSLDYYASEHTVAAIVTFTGVVVFAFALYQLRQQQPPWLLTLIASYLLGAITFLVLSNSAGGSVIMWLFVAPILSCTGLGFKKGLLISGYGAILIASWLFIYQGALDDSFASRLFLSYLVVAASCVAEAHYRRKEHRNLERALEKITSLEKLLPMCAWCKRIRQNEEWLPLEDFLKENNQEVTHGICNNCQQELQK